MNIPEATLATSMVTALMVALSVAWLQWKSRRGAVQPAAAIPPAPASAAAALPESG